MVFTASGTATMFAIVPDPGLLFGLMLLAAIVGGYGARWFHLPRVVGFLIGGAILRVILHSIVVTEDGGVAEQQLQAAAEPLNAIRDLALGLILFTIGGVFERSRIRAGGRSMLIVSMFESGLSFLFVMVGCFVVAIISQNEVNIRDSFSLVLLLGLASIATAPAATLFVLQEYEAKGRITDTILGLTGTNNVLCLILFYATFLILTSLGLVETTGPASQHIWVSLGVTIVGSLGLGVLCGTLISIVHGKLPLAETMLVFFAMFILLGAGEKWLQEHVGLSFNFFLVALVVGAVFANVAIDPQKLAEPLRTVGSPIFAGFFVIAGYSLHVNDLSRMGAVGAAYVVLRVAGKVIGCRIGLRRTHLLEGVDGRLGGALLCQAAVVIGLAAFVQRSWDHPMADQFATIVLGSVVIFELIGPLLVKRCVVFGGEIKAITLMRRPGVSSEESSIVAVTLKAVARLFRPRSTAKDEPVEDLTVEHIMRTNLQMIPASASLDDVLHFIERSTHSHFPVVHDNGDLAGVIHFSDVRDVIYDPAMRELVTAVDLADPDSAIVPMDMPLDALLDEFTSHNVAVLPVTDQADSRNVVGMVEQRDLLRTLHITREPE